MIYTQRNWAQMGATLGDVTDQYDERQKQQAAMLLDLMAMGTATSMSRGDGVNPYIKPGGLVGRWRSTAATGNTATTGSKTLGIDEMVVSDQKFLNSAGEIDWERYAPNGGYVSGGKVSGQPLDTGTIIDRYGNPCGTSLSVWFNCCNMLFCRHLPIIK